MGGDGGSIPGRCDVIRTKGYGFQRNLGGMGYVPNTLVPLGDEHLNDEQRRQLRFTRCLLTDELLKPPIMVDKAGNLYNKEAAIEALMEHRVPEELQKKGFKRLKDLIQVAPRLSDVSPTFPIWDEPAKRLQCCLTGTALPGAGEVLVSWKCGCIFSSKASKELGQSGHLGKVCPVCGIKAGDFKQLVPALKKDTAEQGRKEAPHAKLSPTLNSSAEPQVAKESLVSPAKGSMISEDTVAAGSLREAEDSATSAGAVNASSHEQRKRQFRQRLSDGDVDNSSPSATAVIAGERKATKGASTKKTRMESTLTAA